MNELICSTEQLLKQLTYLCETPTVHAVSIALIIWVTMWVDRNRS